MARPAPGILNAPAADAPLQQPPTVSSSLRIAPLEPHDVRHSTSGWLSICCQSQQYTCTRIGLI